MLYSIDDRCTVFGKYIVENNTTVRACASQYGISKSTVNKDVTMRLQYIDRQLFEDVRKVLDVNKAERHIRGGMATKMMYDKKRSGSD